MQKSFYVTGIGTDIGKTVASSILVQALKAHYWKPIQCGGLDFTDTDSVKKLINWKDSDKKIILHNERFKFKAPQSPHIASKKENIQINLADLAIPKHYQNTGSAAPLIIEGAGGLMVPLNDNDLQIDLIEQLKIPVIFISRHYLGSYNHTLLTAEALKKRKIPVKGIIFNGKVDQEAEKTLCRFSNLPLLGRIPQLESLDAQSVQIIAKNMIEEFNILNKLGSVS